MKNTRQLINNAIGQLEGIGRMIDEERDCQKVIVQMKAAKASLSGIMDKYMKENILRCLNSKKKGKIELEKIISQMIKNN